MGTMDGTGAAYQDPRLASVYERGNEMPAASLRAWAELIAGYAPGGRAVLEVGAGTGMFCAALAEVLPAAEVTGVEPSAPMLAEAERHNAHPRVRYLAGPAEALPVPDAGFDLALLSRVVHHLPDRPVAARELARVLRPGARLVIRTTVRERLDAPVYRYWPRLLETDAERFPSERQIVEDFTPAGFAVHRVHSFSRPVASDLREWRERIGGRAQSKFLALSEAEFAAGLARLDAELAGGGGAGATGAARDGGATGDGGATAPVLERYDVIVLERTPVGA
ncbi:SAM-dependent methyltransferase [Kitasatospora sp. GAS204A]|uniref:class I SAM-dependent methyltransferase n=1 Tax=unclassified Kitasatospora TaxID=2633591 RepID=UPI0024746A8F|nr:class I SAM-dependent methyltransferase [Kitasatospora sp. GAS204B]MDH6122609.1 SAM-dependent methyltransferase [Kitasatospora sp. GAS204B]